MRHPAIPAGRTTPANLLRQRQRIAATKYNHAIVMSLIMFLDACKHRKKLQNVHYQYTSGTLPAHLRSTLISRREFRDGLKSHLFADAYF